MCRKITIVYLCLAAVISCLTSYGQELARQDYTAAASVEQGAFFLQMRAAAKGQGKVFILESRAEEGGGEISFPAEWLAPPLEEEFEQGSYVSSFNYDPEVTSFQIGNGLLGLHFSSLDIQGGGAAQAAAGRDVFLVYDPRSGQINNGGAVLGIIKKRVRYMGCFSAEASHFLLADVNRDGLTDIGVVREGITCDEYFDEKKGVDAISGPSYRQQPVSWHVFRNNHWEHDPVHDGNLSVSYTELPLIGMTMTPVDFAAEASWKSYDPARWESGTGEVPAFIPAYRKKLLSGEGVPEPSPDEISLGEEFVLHKGESALIVEEDCKIKVLDFRFEVPCPKEARCNAQVGIQFEYSHNGKTRKGMNLLQAFGFQNKIIDSDYKTYVKLTVTEMAQ